MKPYLKTFTFVISCLTYSLSVVLNALGIYMLSNLKNELTNQRIFLMNLSISELLYTSGTLCYYAIAELSDKKSTLFAIFSRMSWIFYYLYLISPLVLTVDRFICIAFPWKYKAISTKTKAMMMVFSTWICVLVIALPSLLVTDYETARNNHLSAIALGIGVLVVGFSLIAYTLIGLKSQKQRKLTGRVHNESKILKVATIIIITYTVFEVIPVMVTTVLFKCCHDVAKAYRRLIYMPSGFNTISDPIVYLYNHPPLKTAVKRKVNKIITTLGCLRGRSSSGDGSTSHSLSNTHL